MIQRDREINEMIRGDRMKTITTVYSPIVEVLPYNFHGTDEEPVVIQIEEGVLVLSKNRNVIASFANGAWAKVIVEEEVE